MLPPEGHITLICAIIIGLFSGAVSPRCKTFFGSLGVYLVALMLALILGASVEAHGASKHFAYDFGDHLLHHLAVAILGVTAFHFSLLFMIKAFGDFVAKGTAQPNQVKSYVPHALGLLNLVPPLGCIAQLAYWYFNKDEAVLAGEAKEAFQFQASFFAVLYLVTAISGAIGGVIETALAFLVLLLLIAWAVITVGAALIAKRNGSFRYPVSIRLLRGSQQPPVMGS